jgi:hypothetical protein
MSSSDPSRTTDFPRDSWMVAYTREGGRYSETERLDSAKEAKRKRNAILQTYDDIVTVEVIQETQLQWDGK